METAKSWAEKIEEYLEATGERTTSIAVALRVSEDAVRKWRRGDRQPDGPAQICLERLFAAAKRRALPA